MTPTPPCCPTCGSDNREVRLNIRHESGDLLPAECDNAAFHDERREGGKMMPLTCSHGTFLTHRCRDCENEPIPHEELAAFRKSLEPAPLDPEKALREAHDQAECCTKDGQVLRSERHASINRLARSAFKAGIRHGLDQSKPLPDWLPKETE